MTSARAAIKSNEVGFKVRRMTEHDLLQVVDIEEKSGLSLWGWEGYYTELSAPPVASVALLNAFPPL